MNCGPRDMESNLSNNQLQNNCSNIQSREYTSQQKKNNHQNGAKQNLHGQSFGKVYSLNSQGAGKHQIGRWNSSPTDAQFQRNPNLPHIHKQLGRNCNNLNSMANNTFPLARQPPLRSHERPQQHPWFHSNPSQHQRIKRRNESSNQGRIGQSEDSKQRLQKTTTATTRARFGICQQNYVQPSGGFPTYAQTPQHLGNVSQQVLQDQERRKGPVQKCAYPQGSEKDLSQGNGIDSGNSKRTDEDAIKRLQAEARLLSMGNKFNEAIGIWDRILTLRPRDPEALNQKGMCYMRQGQNSEAMDLYDAALEIDPHHWASHNNKGVILKEKGDLLNAVESYRLALKYGPKDSVAKRNIAMALTELGAQLRLAGCLQPALQNYAEALKHDSNFGPAHFGMGMIFSKLGHYQEALKAYNHALECNPGYVQALCNIGVLYKNNNNVEAAIEYYQRALEIDPNFETARKNMAISYTDLGTKCKNAGDIKLGIKWYKKALFYNPKYPDAWYNLGVACAASGESEEALVYYEIATSFNPQCAEAYNNQGVIYKDLGNLQKSIQYYMKALAVNPNFALTLNNLGVIYTSLGNLGQAYQYCVRAVQANPRYAEAYNNLGVLFRDEGDIKQAISSYDRSLQIDPLSKNAMQNRLLAMNSLLQEHLNFEVPSITNYVFNEHAKWGEAFQALYKCCTSWGNSRTADRPLRIGYISADFFTHSVSYFIELPLRLGDKSRVFNVCYSNVARTDSRTQTFRKLAHKWVNIFNKSAEDIARLVQEDEIDILVELTGHTAGNRLDVMAIKPAPVQVTWIGYPNTTGLKTIDYRFCDAVVDPPDTTQKFTEKLIRLPNSFLCYCPPVDAPSVTPTPALANGFITYGSFNNFAKFNNSVLHLWCSILQRVPGSRLLMKCKPFACSIMKQKVLQRFRNQGIDPRRIDLFPLLPTTKDHLSFYSHVDVCIDTFPYAGTTTTCEAMHMGIPVITLKSQGEDNHAHNVGCSLISNIPSIRHLVAKSPEQYIKRAADLAKDFKKLNSIRQSLRQEMLASPIGDGKTFVKNLEKTYQDLWKTYLSTSAGDDLSTSAGDDVKLDAREQRYHLSGDEVGIDNSNKDAVGNVHSSSQETKVDQESIIFQKLVDDSESGRMVED